MLRPLQLICSDAFAGTKGRIAFLYLLLVVFNVGAWGWALAAFRDYPLLMGSAFLAYGFGLRHAVDADHIAAIDNVTRKLMQEGKRPVAAGFLFSLGHSSIVFLACIGIAWSASALDGRLLAFKATIGVVGTLVSAFFLLLIALINLLVLRGVWRTFQLTRRGDACGQHETDVALAGRGLLARLLKPMFRIVSRSWHMYPLGLLFGLGFDTATEIGLLGISATGTSHHLSAWTILVFPALFTAGMSLVDTTDGVLMLGAYGWAYVKPMRKLYYNMAITSLSVVTALLIGSAEALGVAADAFGQHGVLWRVVQGVNGNFGALGYLIVGTFATSWLLSMLFWRWKRAGAAAVESRAPL